MNASIHREETVFDFARKLSNPAERRAFLAQACADDTALRAKVEELLLAQDDAERFFAEGMAALRPVGGGAGAVSASATPDEKLGTRIGPYKLLERIGEGGCGVVYMAEQEKPVRRRVALKIIKLGMDTKQVIARFEAERQALAMMDHPNIARVLDAGATETGRPYFVMELVRGVRITEYCDQDRLDTDQRLDLFVQVCHAIQHAHQKGIIHRDIKPSNLLVTMHDGVPVPKVIDFGIAKATEVPLTDRTLFTAYAQIIGTPAYMSPEQAEMSGLDVDTRSDIYSLGVLLYELLTGKTPFDQKELLEHGVDEMRRTLREKEPHRPSTKLNTLVGEELTATALHRKAEPPKLKSLLRGDLDWIVMKALEKDRRRRYETANGLAMDIQRHLNNEPVMARPPSRLYRFQKLVQRNRAVFASATVLAVTLIVGSGLLTWLFLKEKEAREQQARLRQDAEQARLNETRLRRQAELREKLTQAAYLVNQQRFSEADRLLEGVRPEQPTVEGAAALRSLGEWHAFQNHWPQATERFNVLLDVNQFESWDVSTLDFLSCGTALVESGNREGFWQFCDMAIARFNGTTNPVAAERILKICLLLPPPEETLRAVAPLAKVAGEASRNMPAKGSADETFFAAWRAISLALLDYRRGNYARSVEWSERCLAFTEYNPARVATAKVIMAMARHQLNQAEESRAALVPATKSIEDEFRAGLVRGSREDGFWFDWVFARVLLRELTGSDGGAAK